MTESAIKLCNELVINNLTKREFYIALILAGYSANPEGYEGFSESFDKVSNYAILQSDNILQKLADEREANNE
jgi:hypothetical protein